MLWAAPLASSLLLYLSFFPANLGFLGWVALAPWLTLVRSPASPRKLCLACWLGGLLFFVPALQWLRVAHPMMHFTWAGLALYCSAYFPLGLALIRSLDRRGWPLALSVPAVWTALEWVRGSVGGGFAWYTLGQTQHEWIALIQIADAGGMWAVSAVVAAANGAAAEWLLALRSGAPRPIRSAVAVALLVAGTLAYGAARLDHEPFGRGPRVGLVQGNIPQGVRNARTGNDQQEAVKAIRSMTDHHVELSNRIAGETPPPDLIVWPETSYPLPRVLLPATKPEGIAAEEWDELTSMRDFVLKRFAEMGTGWGTHALLGLNTREARPDGRVVRYNTALLIDPIGAPVSDYHKMHRVPFGEYVPFRETLPFLKWFSPYKHEYGLEAGQRLTRFELPGRAGRPTATFGVLICYEDTDPTLARRYQREEPVDFLVNISNDGWFMGTEEHEQHLAVARFRAVEARRSLLRAVNMGVSAVIDGDGRVVATPRPTWAASKGEAMTLSADVPLDRRSGLYAVAGDWLPIALAALAALGLLRRTRR